VNWFDKLKSGIRTLVRRGLPDNLWIKCERCHQTIHRKELEKTSGVCPSCSAHFRISHSEYLALLLDEGSFSEVASSVRSGDPLQFEDRIRYADRLRESVRATGLNAAVCTGVGKVDGHRVGVGVHEPRFIMGTLASAEGERICRLVDVCIEKRIPLVLVCRAGGARMMEGAFSLMQMAKINARLARLAEARLPYISILTDPTTAGVSASYALVGDVNIAEPNALIGFTGERITGRSVGEEEQEALRQAQRAERVLDHGFVDMVVPRSQMRETVGGILGLLRGGTGVPGGEEEAA